MCFAKQSTSPSRKSNETSPRPTTSISARYRTKTNPHFKIRSSGYGSANYHPKVISKPPSSPGQENSILATRNTTTNLVRSPGYGKTNHHPVAPVVSKSPSSSSSSRNENIVNNAVIVRTPLKSTGSTKSPITKTPRQPLTSSSNATPKTKPVLHRSKEQDLITSPSGPSVKITTRHQEAPGLKPSSNLTPKNKSIASSKEHPQLKSPSNLTPSKSKSSPSAAATSTTTSNSKSSLKNQSSMDPSNTTSRLIRSSTPKGASSPTKLQIKKQLFSTKNSNTRVVPERSKTSLAKESNTTTANRKKKNQSDHDDDVVSLKVIEPKAEVVHLEATNHVTEVNVNESEEVASSSKSMHAMSTSIVDDDIATKTATTVTIAIEQNQEDEAPDLLVFKEMSNQEEYHDSDIRVEVPPESEVTLIKAADSKNSSLGTSTIEEQAHQQEEEQEPTTIEESTNEVVGVESPPIEEEVFLGPEVNWIYYVLK